jgi:hypothetical protein
MSVHDSDGRFLEGNFILKTVMFRDVMTVLNERKRLKMVIRSVPDAVSLILGRTEWQYAETHCMFQRSSLVNSTR